MTLHAPQLIFLALMVLGTGVALAKDGEPKGNYSFFWSLFGDIVILALLKWGGFFG